VCSSDLYAAAHQTVSGPITRYLELGVNCGVSAWIMAQIMPKGGMIVGVDLLTAQDDPRVMARNAAAASIFEQRRTHVRMIGADTRDAVAEAYEFSPYDALLIDADHTYAGAAHDWAAYVHMVRPGGLIVMHDIANTAYECGKVWRAHRADLTDWAEFGNLGLGVK
jgi:predicted O-methyltransferase YrrM